MSITSKTTDVLAYSLVTIQIAVIGFENGRDPITSCIFIGVWLWLTLDRMHRAG